MQTDLILRAFGLELGLGGREVRLVFVVGLGQRGQRLRQALCLEHAAAHLRLQLLHLPREVRQPVLGLGLQVGQLGAQRALAVVGAAAHLADRLILRRYRHHDICG